MKNWPISPKLSKLALSLTLAVGVISLLPTPSVANLPLEITTLPLPEIKSSENKSVQVKNNDDLVEQAWKEHTVKIGKNDSLSTALDKVKINASTTYNIGRLSNSNLITNLRVGDELKIWVDKNDNLQKILYPKSRTLAYEVVKTDTGYQIHEKRSKVEIRTETAYGTIDGAFYLAAEKAGLSAKSIMNIADMFAWDIDFVRELRKGDTLKVIYETRYLNGEYLGDGDVLAAQITTDGGKDKHNAFILRDKKGIIGFYDENGKNLKKAFLRAPVDYVRITSKFNPKRFHPVLKKWRSHRGVDYGGPKNTPIRVTGNGKIIARGWGNGYGNHIKVQHAGKYMTVYGHLNKFGKYKKGQFVKQGDVIGYMGMTGLATGVHLHYEFRINGKHVDPLKVKFPAAGPIASKYKDKFNQNSQFLLSQLNRLNTHTHIARSFE
ncbi:peptidoglycan DD-metalloendopeptidase family protein [Thiomicrorhabdus sp. Kp2]|uniref:peptidoglycan DD-metalloendopeptidase family protein n=1 Tax=Thiomicrorhabdus sp. Kp2 TaxID=1123518 RepID=UPI0004135063|nr:peptidoglycan DD-metalloendopeptidase family protein [Thiomicrorhabdus sp. Kp2]